MGVRRVIAIVETDEPGEGNRHVVGIHLVVIMLYGILAIVLVKVLFRLAATSGVDASAVGVSWLLGIVLMMVSLHGAAAYGARLGRRWARTLSRALGILLLVAVPVGTVVGFLIFRNTRPGGWTTGTINGGAKVLKSSRERSHDA
jgi:hypothetical protein